MEAPDFWDDAEVSQKKMKELKSMKDDMETYHNLVSQMEDMETMIEMGYEENDPEIIPEIQEMLDQFIQDFDNIRVKTLLSGEYDSENAIIKLNAGAGGTEACDWCGMLYRMYSRWVDRKGFTMEVLDYLDGDEAGVKSVTFQVNGEKACQQQQYQRVNVFGGPAQRDVRVPVEHDPYRVDRVYAQRREFQHQGRAGVAGSRDDVEADEGRHADQVGREHDPQRGDRPVDQRLLVGVYAQDQLRENREQGQQRNDDQVAHAHDPPRRAGDQLRLSGSHLVAHERAGR